MTAIVYTVPFLTKPAFEELEKELLECGYRSVKDMKIDANGKYNPPLRIRRIE